jgi:hypothetical protein
MVSFTSIIIYAHELLQLYECDQINEKLDGPANQLWRISPGSKMVGPISIFQEFGIQ